MPQISQRIHIYKCRFHNSFCRICGKDVQGKYCIGKRELTRYCLTCAVVKKIVTREDCEAAGVEYPLKQMIRLHISKKLTLPQLKDYGIKQNEILPMLQVRAK